MPPTTDPETPPAVHSGATTDPTPPTVAPPACVCSGRDLRNLRGVRRGGGARREGAIDHAHTETTEPTHALHTRSAPVVVGTVVGTVVGMVVETVIEMMGGTGGGIPGSGGARVRRAPPLVAPPSP